MKKIILASTLAMALAAPALAEQPKAPQNAASGSFVTVAGANEMNASEWIGAPVKNAKDETVGDINDLIFGADGKIVAVVAGVGGFLGLGEKNVGLPYDEVKLTKNKDGERIAMVEVTKDELMNAPEFTSDRKTMRQRASEASEAASKAYENAKKEVKEGYAAAKEKVSEGYDAAKKKVNEGYDAAKKAVTEDENNSDKKSTTQ
jgi:hypothetical protein